MPLPKRYLHIYVSRYLPPCPACCSYALTLLLQPRLWLLVSVLEAGAHGLGFTAQLSPKTNREVVGNRLHCSQIPNSHPHPCSSCQGFPARKGTRELLPRGITHSPRQATPGRALCGLWRAAPPQLSLFQASARGYSCTCPVVLTSVTLW